MPSNCKGIRVQTHRLYWGFTKYAADMNSSAMAHIPSFMKIGSNIQK
jgi:hypothetical protein